MKWFCETCIKKMDEIIGIAKNKKLAKYKTSSLTAKDLVNLSENRPPICENFRHGSFPHGMSGKKEVDGKKFIFSHPKICTWFCKYGSDPQNGCADLECKFLHSILCRNPLRYGMCNKEQCTYTHLVGTKRTYKTLSDKFNRPTNFRPQRKPNQPSQYRYHPTATFRNNKNYLENTNRYNTNHSLYQHNTTQQNQTQKDYQYQYNQD